MKCTYYIVLIVSLTKVCFAQNSKPISFGIYTELGLARVQAFNLTGASNGDDDFVVTPTFCYKIGGTIEYQALNWLGLRSGLLFQQRTYEYRYRYDPFIVPTNEEGIRKIYSATIPVIFRLKPGKVFSLNMGAEFNFNVGRNSEDYWDGLIEPEYKVADVALYGSLEFKLYRGLQIGTGISWGLTPWGTSSVRTSQGYVGYSYSHRGIFMNLQYVFGVK